MSLQQNDIKKQTMQPLDTELVLDLWSKTYNTAENRIGLTYLAIMLMILFSRIQSRR